MLSIGGLAGVQAVVRVLEHDLDGAAQGGAVEVSAPGSRRWGRRPSSDRRRLSGSMQAADKAGDGAFAGSAFADEAEAAGVRDG